ncbi:unnamed protein product, partial [marine sediment metagenome]
MAIQRIGKSSSFRAMPADLGAAKNYQILAGVADQF